MSYPEYKQITQFALDKLGLEKTFDIQIYDTSTFIDVVSFHSGLINTNPKTKNEVELRNLEEYGVPQLPIGGYDCIFLAERTKNQDTYDFWIKVIKRLIKKGICSEKHLKTMKKIYSLDFLIIINRDVIDLYVRKESKFTCLVHEVLHLAQEEGLTPQGLTENQIDDLAKPIVKEFLSQKGEPFIGDMFITPKDN